MAAASALAWYDIPQDILYSSPTVDDMAWADIPQELTFRQQVCQSLLAHGELESYVKRLEHCATFFTYRSDGTHTWRVNSSRCGCQLCCPPCNEVAFRKAYDKWVLLEPLVPSEFTVLTFKASAEEPLEKLVGRVGKFMRRKLPKAKCLGVVKVARDRYQVMYFGSLTTDHMRATVAQFPTMHYQRFKPCKFKEALNDLLQQPIASDPQEVARLQWRWAGEHLIRSWGDDFSVYKTATYTEKSSQAGNPLGDQPLGRPKRGCTCPICGAAATHESRWFYQGTQVKVKDLTWTPISPPVAHSRE